MLRTVGSHIEQNLNEMQLEVTEFQLEVLTRCSSLGRIGPHSHKLLIIVDCLKFKL